MNSKNEWALIERMMTGDFDPDQPRDDDGRWTDTGASAGGSESAEFKESYDIEMEDAKSFPAAFVLEDGMSNDVIAYQMYVHKDVSGNSLIADTQKDVDFLKSEIDNADDMGASYGMSQDAINGMKKALQEKVELRESAIKRMQECKPEYDKYVNQARVGNAKAERMRKAGKKWM